MANRVILVVMDSVGIGEMPDAHKFGDQGSNTVGNIALKYPGFQLPNLVKLGLGNIEGKLNIGQTDAPIGAFGRAAEVSPGKDTTTGHWEIAGVEMDYPFPMFPQGFPPSIMDKFEAAIGISTIGNKAASGTDIINELGEEHLNTKRPIVYTSADSVFQVAMHEDIYPIERQYEICQIARDILTGEDAVGRVIARPFKGKPGNFQRTGNRKDFSLIPPQKTVLRCIKEAGQHVKAVGKINDIFAGDGITEYVKTANNMEGVDRTLEYMADSFTGIIFTNLVDFDMMYGHRRDVKGYAETLMEFDKRLPELLAATAEDDVLIITADHGNDPTMPGTDHTREYIPVLVYGKSIKAGVNLGTIGSFAHIGATVAEILGVEAPASGTSFLSQINAEINV